MRLPAAARIAPITAGVAGLAWFWAELAPQRFGFFDTDDPSVSLRFLAAHPEAWVQAGLALAIASIALLATVIVVRDRLAAGLVAAGRAEAPDLAARTVSAVGFVAAAMLLGMALVRLAGGPVLYVAGLRQEWGEAAYLVTQFVGIQLLGVGGLALLALWIAGVSWFGARRGVVPPLVAALAVLPALRFIPALGLGGLLEGLWLVYMAAIPAGFAWLILLGASPSARLAPNRITTSPAIAGPSPL